MRTKEEPRLGLPGVPMLLFLLAAGGIAAWRLVVATQAQDTGGILVALGVDVLAAFGLAGLFMVNPNEARVLQLFGKYVGTIRTDGLRWSSPFYSKKRISL